MDKNTYLRKAKQRLEDEYLQKLNELNECFKSDNVITAVYIDKNIFETLDYKVSNGDLELDTYDLKTLLRGKLRFSVNTRYTNSEALGYVTNWFVDKCPKCGCYLYYPWMKTQKSCPKHDKYGFGICANCFEERVIVNTKAVNFPTERGYQLVNYKFYIKAGTMNRKELEQFMDELGVEMYGSEILRGIERDLKRLELGDVIDSNNVKDNK